MLLLAALAGAGTIARHLIHADLLIALLGGAGQHAPTMLGNAVSESAVRQVTLANLGTTAALLSWLR